MADYKVTKKDQEIMDIVSNFMNMERKMSLDLDSTVADDLEELLSSYDITCYTGQKRTVIPLSDSVIKVVSSRDALQDNINAILTSEHLRDLNEQGKIEDEDLERFALVDMVNDDPFIIQAKKYIPIKESKGFKEWDKENKNDSRFDGGGKNERLGYFILEEERLYKDQRTISEILGKYCIASDFTAWKVTENQGTDEEDGGGLTLIDLGSILPKYKDVQPRCSLCSSTLSLVRFVSGPGEYEKQDKAMLMKTGLYCCSSDNCRDGKDNIRPAKANNNLTDSCVFDQYQQAAKDSTYYVRDCANLANIFFPTVDVTSFKEFKKELIADTGEKFSGSDLRTIWLNSIPYIIMDKVEGSVVEIDEVIEDVLDSEGDELDEYADMVELVEDETGEDVEDDDLLAIFATIMFLKFKILEDGETDLTMFDIIGADTKSDFIEMLEEIDGIDEDDYDELYDTVKCYMKED